MIFNFCPGCGIPMNGLEEFYLFCYSCFRTQQDEIYAAERQMVFSHYGQTCACCGTPEDLAIDHINGDGGERRRRDPSHGKLYRWLVANGFPEGFQTLCRRCNSSKHTGTTCWIHRKYLGPARVNVIVNVNITLAA